MTRSKSYLSNIFSCSFVISQIAPATLDPFFFHYVANGGFYIIEDYRFPEYFSYLKDVNDGTNTNEDDEDIEILEDIALKELIAEVEDSPSQANDITETADDTATSIDQLPDDVWSVKDNQLADAGVIRFREDIVELGGSDSSRRNTTKKKRKRGSSNQQSKRR